MSEIRTCEEYVVNELLNTKENVEAKNQHISLLQSTIDNARRIQQLVFKHLTAELRESDYRSMKYINISGTIWSDDEDYEEILKILTDNGYDFAKED